MGQHANSTREYQRILIIKPSSLGDIVHALPVLVALRSAYPRAYIAWLAASPFAPLLDEHPLLDEVIRFDRARLGRMWRNPRAAGDFLRLVHALRGRRFDLVIDLQGLFRSGFLALASGARTRIGFADGREFAPAFLTRRVSPPPAMRHAVERNLEIARALHLPDAVPRFPLAIRDAELKAARQLLAAADAPADQPFIAIVTGARWNTKLWRPERWAAAIDALQHSHGRRCVLLGAPADLPYVRTIETFLYTRPANLVGRTSLRELAAVLSLADRVICHDSGPMHIAAALGKPIVAIFGPTDPDRCGPYYEGDRAGVTNPTPRPPVVLAGRQRTAARELRQWPGAHPAAARILIGDVPCAPCYLRECWHHSCMQRLASDVVVQAVIGAG